MQVGKSFPATGLLSSTIVAAGGLTGGGVTGDNEGYSAATNSWKTLAADPTPRQATCSGAITGMLYSAGGTNGGVSPLTLNETFSLAANKWTTHAAIPNGTAGAGNAVVNNLLYCFGGSSDSRISSAVFNYVQIYQP
jgi:hypothetical protein